MIKVTFCLHRLPELTHEAFLDYWLNHHGPLVRSFVEALSIRRYVQSHGLITDLVKPMAKARAAPEPFDGVAELWFDGLHVLEENMRKPEAAEAGRALLADERTFIDLPRSPIWYAEEHEVIAGT